MTTIGPPYREKITEPEPRYHVVRWDNGVRIGWLHSVSALGLRSGKFIVCLWTGLLFGCSGGPFRGADHIWSGVDAPEPFVLPVEPPRADAGPPARETEPPVARRAPPPLSTGGGQGVDAGPPVPADARAPAREADAAPVPSSPAPVPDADAPVAVDAGPTDPCSGWYRVELISDQGYCWCDRDADGMMRTTYATDALCSDEITSVRQSGH